MMYNSYAMCIFLDMCDAYVEYSKGSCNCKNRAIGTFNRLWQECLEQFHTTRIYDECFNMALSTYNVDEKTRKQLSGDLSRGYTR